MILRLTYGLGVIFRPGESRQEFRNWTKAHRKSEIRDLKLDSKSSQDGAAEAVHFEISDFGFAMGFRPISKFLAHWLHKYVDTLGRSPTVFVRGKQVGIDVSNTTCRYPCHGKAAGFKRLLRSMKYSFEYRLPAKALLGRRASASMMSYFLAALPM
jgi:hypothetical protein